MCYMSHEDASILNFDVSLLSNSETTAHCNTTLEQSATHCNTLQHTATHCTTWHPTCCIRTCDIFANSYSHRDFACAWQVPFICVTWFVFICVTCFIVTSHICVTCFIVTSHICVTCFRVTWHICVTCLTCDVMQSYVTWCSDVWRDAVLCDVMQSHVMWCSPTWRDAIICAVMQSHVTWYSDMICNVFHSDVTHMCDVFNMPHMCDVFDMQKSPIKETILVASFIVTSHICVTCSTCQRHTYVWRVQHANVTHMCDVFDMTCNVFRNAVTHMCDVLNMPHLYHIEYPPMKIEHVRTSECKFKNMSYCRHTYVWRVWHASFIYDIIVLDMPHLYTTFTRLTCLIHIWDLHMWHALFIYDVCMF